MRRILLLDDEINVLRALQRTLRTHLKIKQLEIETFSNPFDALNRICEAEFDLVISDYRMPEMSGGAFLQALKDVAPNTVRMMLSASTEFETAMSAINEAQVFRFISKPWQVDELQQTIMEALALRDRLLAKDPDAELTPQQLEAKRLEEEEPGILKVNWGPDGSIIL